jgi:hypothetical protein
MSHSFKARDAIYKGEPCTVIRGANPNDVEEGVELKAPHFLIRTADGQKQVVPAAKVKVMAEAGNA